MTDNEVTMNDQFNKVINILKNHPDELDIEDVGNIFTELVENPNLDLLLDMIVTRSIEDRTLFCAYLVDIQRAMEGKGPIEEVIDNFMQVFKRKEPIYKLIIPPYPIKKYEMMVGGLWGAIRESENLPPEEAQKRFLGFIFKNPTFFTIRSLFAVCMGLLNAHEHPETAVILSQLYLVIKAGRKYFVEDEDFKQILFLFHKYPESIDNEALDKIVLHYLKTAKLFDVAEIIAVTRSLKEKLGVVDRLIDFVKSAQSKSLDTRDIEARLMLIYINDPALDGIVKERRKSPS